jgi:glycosyltransferase involved in cell wall biosynthesis
LLKHRLDMRLRVGIDAWNLVGDRRGSGRYVREIVNHWSAWQSRDLQLCLLVPERFGWLARGRYLRELNVADLPVQHRGAGRTLDVVWYPWNGMSWIAPVTSVSTIHDASRFSLAPSDQAEREREQRPLRVAAANAARIITSSHFSKAELVQYLQLAPDRVDVIHLGVKDLFTHAQRSNSSGDRLRYVLFVGEPEERKGLSNLLRAMELLSPSLGETTELVIAGASGQYQLPPLPSSVRVRNLGWVDDETLAGLYANAAVLAYPSAYEGFGLPVIEAMAAGAPVIASDTPSLREAGEDAALYVKPLDDDGLARAIEEVLTSETLSQDLRQRGFVRMKALTWESTARRTLQVLERAVHDAARGRSPASQRP